MYEKCVTLYAVKSLGYVERNKTITSDQTAFFKKQKQLCHEENDDGAGSGMYQEKHQTRVALERYCQLLNNFCQRMKASRYDQNYRFQVLKSGVEGFEKMLEVKRGGGRPINQQRS